MSAELDIAETLVMEALGKLKAEIEACDEDDREWTSDGGNGVSAEGALAAIDTAIRRVAPLLENIYDYCDEG